MKRALVFVIAGVAGLLVPLWAPAADTRRIPRAEDHRWLALGLALASRARWLFPPTAV